MAARLVLLQRRNWTDRTTGSRFRRQRIATSYRADGLSAAESTSGLACARGARVRMPGRSFGMRLVRVIGTGGSTAAYRTAAFVRLVAKGASFPASHQRWTVRVRCPALAERAIVLVHHQSAFAVQVAFHFGADLLSGLVDQDTVVGGFVEGLRCLAGAYRATSLVLHEVAVQATVRQLRADLVDVRGRLHRCGVLVLLWHDAAAERAIDRVVRVSMVARQVAVFQGVSARWLGFGFGFGFGERRVRRYRTVGATLPRIRWYSVLAGLAHRFLTGHSTLLADAAQAVRLLPSFAQVLRLVLVDAVFRPFGVLRCHVHPRYGF